MANAAIRSLSTITQLLNQYGTSLLTNTALRPLLNGESDEDLASAIARYSTKPLSRLTFDQWVSIFSWRTGLSITLVPYLDAAHIVSMMNAFIAQPSMASYLSKKQLVSVLALTGAHYITTLNKNVLSALSTNDLVAALLSRPASEIKTITDSEWTYLGQFQPLLKSRIADPIDELQNEIKNLPTEFQSKFSALISDSGLYAYSNPFLSAAELVTKQYDNVTSRNGSDFILLFDSYYKNYIAKNPSAYGALTLLYNQVLTRKALSSYDLKESTIPVSINGFLNWVTSTVNTIGTTIRNTTEAEFLDYNSKVNNSLRIQVGSFQSYKDVLTDIRSKILEISGTELDTTTHAKFDPRIIEYLLNNTSSDGNSNLSYAGQNGLTFKSAIKNTIRDLLSSADQYINATRWSMKNMATGQNFYGMKDKLSQFFDVLNRFASLSAGLAKTNTAFENNSAMNQIIANVSNISTDTNNAETYIKTAKESWFSSTVSGISGTNYYNKINNSLSNYYNLFKGYGILSSFHQEVNTFISDLKSTLSDVHDRILKGRDLLGSTVSYKQSIDPHFSDHVDTPLKLEYKDLYGNNHIAYSTIWYVPGSSFSYSYPAENVAGYAKSVYEVSYIHDPNNSGASHVNLTLYGYNPI